MDKKRKSLGTAITYLANIFDAQNLSSKKYQTALAKGSTIATVKAK